MTAHASAHDQQAERTTPQVTVYTSPTCGFCHMVEEYLQSKNVPFIEKDISTDQEALLFIHEKAGQAITPTTIIGEHVIFGFNRPQLDEALTAAGLGKPA